VAEILIVSLGSTSGLRAADVELAAALERAGADVAVVSARPPREVRTLVLTDLVWARAARAAAVRGIDEHRPRAVVYATVTAALLWPRPGAIRYDAPAAANRPGRHGLWQRPLERRRLREAPLLVPQAPGTLAESPSPHAPAVVVPIPVEPSGPPAAERDIAAITYAANPEKKGLDRVLAAWAAARREGEELVVTGTDRVPRSPGVRATGPLEPAAYRALLRRARVFVTAPRREDYGVAQLEALADGCLLVTTPAPGPYAALPLAGGLDPRLVGEDLGPALRAALDDPSPGYAERAGRDRALPPRGRGRGRPLGAPAAPAQRARRLSGRAQRARLRSLASCFHGSVFATSSLVSHARRAVAMPQRVWISVLGPWASESMTILTPAAAALRAWTSSRSRRSGAELISSMVPVRTAASMRRSTSTA
jgi:glycosyltransferase involved in cell wall biosynthesis